MILRNIERYTINSNILELKCSYYIRMQMKMENGVNSTWDLDPLPCLTSNARPGVLCGPQGGQSRQNPQAKAHQVRTTCPGSGPNYLGSMERPETLWVLKPMSPLYRAGILQSP